MFETFEGRRMLSSTLVNGVLTVTGTAGADNIYINVAAGGKTNVMEGGVVKASYTSTSIKSVVVNAQAGNDSVYIGSIGAINAKIDGGIGDDILSGGDGNDTILGGDGKDVVSGNKGNDSLDGGAGDDNLNGGVGNDTMLAGTGNDLLTAGDGNDSMDGGLGADRFRGGLGTDVVTYATRTNPVTVDISGLTTEVADDGEVGEKDFVETDVENLIGGSGNDKFTGTVFATTTIPTGYTNNNKFVGNGGNDTLLGGDGNDSLDGSSGNDSLSGGKGNDTLTGGTGTDTLNGDDGDDTFYAKDAVKDILNGGAGTDKANRDNANGIVDSATSIESYF